MSDEISNNADDDSTNPLQSNQVIKEAFEVSENDARSESEEGWAIEALSRSFEDYVRNYQDTWQQAWQESIDAYEQDVENWQNLIAGFQADTPKAGKQPTPQPARKTSPATKSKPQKSGS